MLYFLIGLQLLIGLLLGIVEGGDREGGDRAGRTGQDGILGLLHIDNDISALIDIYDYFIYGWSII